MKKIFYLLLIIFFLFLLTETGFGQSLNSKSNGSIIDSVEIILSSSFSEDKKFESLKKWIERIIDQSPENAKAFIKRAVNALESSGQRKMAGDLLNEAGAAYQQSSQFSNSLEMHTKAAFIRKEINDKPGIAGSLGNIGNVYLSMGNYQKALMYNIESLKGYEEINDKKNIAICDVVIGNIYIKLNIHSKAKNYLILALEHYTELDDKTGIAGSLYNLGLECENEGNFSEAMSYNKKAIEFSKKYNNQFIYALSIVNVGNVLKKQNHYLESLEQYKNALNILKKFGDKYSVASLLNSIGDLYCKLNRSREAISYQEKALAIAKEIEASDIIKESYLGLAKAHKLQHDYQRSLEYQELYSDIKDSIYSGESSKNIAEMQTRFETEKKEKEIQMLTKDNEIQTLAFSKKESELKRQKQFTFFVIIGLLLVISLGFFIYKGYRQKQKANIALENAYSVIENKNKNITDSINYAKKIQTAILPSLLTLRKIFPDSFVFLKPKDIVSGDFYFFTEVIINESRSIVIAVLDCTGHGVPGAFMSMIGNDLLSQIIIEKKITVPAEILNHLNNGIITALKQDQEFSESKDGMDIALCIFNVETKELSYSGAYRPLLIFKKSKNSLEEIKADRQSIGGVKQDSGFTNHIIKLSPGDSFYLFTDGYSDQFGGKNGKKFKYKQLHDLILNSANKQMEEQKIILATTIENWKGNLEQVDDILIIGIRI